MASDPRSAFDFDGLVARIQADADPVRFIRRTTKAAWIAHVWGNREASTRLYRDALGKFSATRFKNEADAHLSLAYLIHEDAPDWLLNSAELVLLKWNPEDSRTIDKWRNLAIIWASRGNRPGMERSFRQYAAHAETDRADALKPQLLAKRNDVDETLAALQAFDDAYPELRGHAHHDVARIFAGAGNHALAQSLWRQYLEAVVSKPDGAPDWILEIQLDELLDYGQVDIAWALETGFSGTGNWGIGPLARLARFETAFQKAGNLELARQAHARLETWIGQQEPASSQCRQWTTYALWRAQEGDAQQATKILADCFTLLSECEDDADLLLARFARIRALIALQQTEAAREELLMIRGQWPRYHHGHWKYDNPPMEWIGCAIELDDFAAVMDMITEVGNEYIKSDSIQCALEHPYMESRMDQVLQLLALPDDPLEFTLEFLWRWTMNHRNDVHL